jgi:uncharacterized membrane protein YccC
VSVAARKSAAPVITGMLGLAGPIAAGVLIGHARVGMVVSLGGLALSGEGKGETLRERIAGLSAALIAGSAAVLFGTAIGRDLVLTSIGVPTMAFVAGALGGISRSLARATTQFILFTIIATSLGDLGAPPLGTTVLFFVGAVWTAAVSLISRWLFPVSHVVHDGEPVVQRPRSTAGRLLRRWRATLDHLAGWQYALRIGACLAVAQAFEWVWPHHHGYWVSLTVAIVVRRTLPGAWIRMLERAAGTILGVVLTSLLVIASPPVWATIAVIAMLAAARPVLLDSNYTAYAAVMTPLVLLLLDLGREPSWTLIADRLVATLVGCAIAVTLGYLAWTELSMSARAAAE